MEESRSTLKTSLRRLIQMIINHSGPLLNLEDIDNKHTVIAIVANEPYTTEQSIPRCILEFTNLRILILRDQCIVGKIPRLPAKIVMLDLSYNRLVGKIPYRLLDNHIDTLILSGNRLCGKLPTNLMSCSRIELQYNRFDSRTNLYLYGLSTL